MWTPAKVTDTIDGVEIVANNQGNRATSYLSPSWMYRVWSVISCFPRVSQTLVDLNNNVIDVSSGCDLSLVARDTEAPAVEKLTDTSLEEVKGE